MAARLAVFIDGGYMDKLAELEFGIRVDYAKFSEEIKRQIESRTPDSVDLLRTYYYHCLPYQGDPPTDEERERFARKRKFFDALGYLRRFQIREGRLVKLGTTESGQPIFQQKKVDLLLGLDFALLAGKGQVSHVAIVSGDSDLLPAVEVAKTEGVSVWLIHGPRRSQVDGRSTYAQELWHRADERVEIDTAFMGRISRN